MSNRAQTPEPPVPQSSIQGDVVMDLDISSLFAEPLLAGPCLSSDNVRQGREALVTVQRENESLTTMLEQALTQQRDVAPTTMYFLKNGVLFRRWLPSTFPKEDAVWASVEQLVVPVQYHQALLEMAHDGRFARHLGVRKTLGKLTQLYFWPGIVRSV